MRRGKCGETCHNSGRVGLTSTRGSAWGPEVDLRTNWVNVRDLFQAGIRGPSGENIKSHAWPGLLWGPDSTPVSL